MNCREVTAILDDAKVDSLDPALRRQAQAHVAACTDCARVWHLQASLATLPDMALPANFSARCRTLVAAGPQAAVSSRAGNRVLRMGVFAALAAAAAMLVFLLRPTVPVAPTAIVSTARIVEATPPIVDAIALEPTAEPLLAVAVEAAPERIFTVRVVPYQVPTAQQMDAEGGSAALRSIVEAGIRATSANPAWIPTLQSLYTALIEELRGVPGLALVASDPVEVPPSSKHYRLKIAPMVSVGADGTSAPINNRYVAAILTTEQLLPGGKTVSRLGPNSSIDLQAACSGAAPAADTPCYDVRGVAAAMVRALLRDVFPPELSVTRGLRAKLQDASLDSAQRFTALDELFKLQKRTDDLSLLRDPGVVRAVIELAANADPTLRAQLWRTMRGVGSAALIEPLINSLLQDPDNVRLAAIETMAADFRGDPRVHSALEATALGDAGPLVRAVAERGLSGEEGWRQYVVASLKDQNRPAAQRLEALVYYLYPPLPDAAESRPSNADYSWILKELLDDGTIRALAAALPEAGAMHGAGSNLLANFGSLYARNPAVSEMLLNYLEHDPQPGNRMIVVQPLALVLGNEPRVREALVKALNSDPDPKVRAWIRQVMGDKAP